MGQAPTLRTIAKAAGVSHETVARALRNDPKISPKTKSRIAKLAEKVGYQSNPLVQALMRSRFGLHARKTTANVVFLKGTWGKKDWWQRQPFIDQIEGTLARLGEMGFDASELVVPAEEMYFEHLDRILKSRGVRGIVVGSMPPSCRNLVLDWDNFAAVGIGLSLCEPKIDRVAPDFTGGLERAVQELLRRGYQRPGLAIRPDQDERRQYWVSAIWRHLQQTRLAPASRMPLYYARFEEAKAKRWYKRYKPDVVLSLDLRWLDCFESMGLKVPEEVGFIALETFDSHSDMEPSGINIHVRKLAALAAELLAEKMLRNDYGVPAQRHTLLAQPDWQEGRTLRAPAASR